MAKNWKLFITLAALVLVVGGAALLFKTLDPAAGGGTAATTSAPSAGDPTAATEAPQYLKMADFTAYTRAGDAFALSSLLGKPIVLNFWASWCGPCQSEMPDFQTVFDELGEEVHFAMVNLTDGGRETLETAAAYVDAGGYTFPVYYDTDTAGAYAYAIRSIPQTYIFDRNGYLVGYREGVLSLEVLRKVIEAAHDQGALTDGLAE